MDKVCLVTATDADYLMATEVMLRSVDANYHGEEKLDVYMLVPEKLLGWTFKEGSFKNLNVVLRHPEGMKSDAAISAAEKMFPLNSRFPHASMYRFFIADTFQDYHKVIYIDPDTIIARDIQPLLDFPLLETDALAAFPETHLTHEGNDSFKDTVTFNSGVMVINVRAWRQSRASTYLLRVANSFSDWTGAADQDVLNIHFRGRWTPLPMSFNYLINVYPDIEINAPLVIHWAGRKKPWSNAVNDRWRQLWKMYRQQGPTTA